LPSAVVKLEEGEGATKLNVYRRRIERHKRYKERSFAVIQKGIVAATFSAVPA
jgi:hypothetical protein